MLRKLEHFAEEAFGSPRVYFCAEHKVNRLASRKILFGLSRRLRSGSGAG